ncbi:MAG: hypothetical protein MHM6MM_003851 [Cercozoa sp. M6MM]
MWWIAPLLLVLGSAHALREEVEFQMENFRVMGVSHAAIYGKQDIKDAKFDPVASWEFDLTRSPEYKSRLGSVAVVVAPVSVTEKLGAPLTEEEKAELPDTVDKDSKRHWCCTRALFDAKRCDEIGFPVFPKLSEDEEARVFKRRYELWDDVDVVNVQGAWTPLRADTYRLVLASCDHDAGPLDVSAQVYWFNPYGWLGGEMYGIVSFYGWLAGIYLVAGVAWLFVTHRHKNSVMAVQNAVTMVLSVAMVEMAVWFSNWQSLNAVGVRSNPPFFVGMLLSVLRRTASRMLVLAVSLGYGVVHSTQGTDSLGRGVALKLWGIGVVYFVASLCYEYFFHFRHHTRVTFGERLVVMTPVAVLDAVFYWWIFVALSRTIVHLQHQRQTAKLAHFRKFTKLLSGSLIVAFLLSFWHVFYVSSGRASERWSNAWFYENGAWVVLYSAVLFGVMYLWRPTEHSKDYAYAQQLPMSGDVDMADLHGYDAERGGDALDELDRDLDAFSAGLGVSPDGPDTVSDDES